MKQVLLIFPDTTTLSKFLFFHHITDLNVNMHEASLKGILHENLITEACTAYAAIVQRN